MAKPEIDLDELLAELSTTDASQIDVWQIYPEPPMSTKLIQASSAISIMVGQPPLFRFKSMVWQLGGPACHRVELTWEGIDNHPLLIQHWGGTNHHDLMAAMTLRGIAAHLGIGFDPCPEERE